MIKPKLHNFENSILNNLLDKDYINHNETIIIAVSGGKDSMALLYAMTRINPLLRIKIVATHINHHLRANSSEDELFVRTFCKEKNIELIIDHLNPNQNRHFQNHLLRWNRQKPTLLPLAFGVEGYLRSKPPFLVDYLFSFSKFFFSIIF